MYDNAIICLGSLGCFDSAHSDKLNTSNNFVIYIYVHVYRISAMTIYIYIIYIYIYIYIYI